MLPFPLWLPILLAAIIILIVAGFGASSTPVLTVVLLASSGIFAGGLVMVAGAVVPTFREFPPGGYIKLHETLDRYIERFMPKTALLTVLLGLALTWLHMGAARARLIAGVLLTLTVSLISQFRMVPLNHIVRSWNPEAPPAETNDLRQRWCRLHLVRTVAGVLALAVFAVAAVLHDAGH